jgi:peptide-methionine (S)-S-oxide reductase
MSFFYRAIREGVRTNGTLADNIPQLLLPELCIQGREMPIKGCITKDTKHAVTGNSLDFVPEGSEVVCFGMGCFWCSESIFFKKPGIYSTSVGYAQGVTKNPTYEEVCSGKTNHSEVVRIVFNPRELSFKELLRNFWEKHDPTSPMRQGNDIGTQYRSGIYYTTEEQKVVAEESKRVFEDILGMRKPGSLIATEIEQLKTFYFGEEYHQQYDLKPGSREYCGLRPTGCKMPSNF